MFRSWCKRAFAATLALSLAAAGGLTGLAGPLTRPVAAAAPDGVVFTAAGDIDGCSAGQDTGRLVEKTNGPVATIGDNAYPSGSAGDYSKCYDPTWGQFKGRTHPIPGNHDYDVSKATPYYQYFGAAAGPPGSGWYSYDVGSWHMVALNSNCGVVDCTREAGWLDGDLAAHPSACILAYWHHPLFTSGTSGGDKEVGAFWHVLYAHGATLVLNGHDHDYERFSPQDPLRHADPQQGIREFIVGTGGAALGSLAGDAPNSEVRNNNTFGVLELTLRTGSYDWKFVPVAGSRFTDSGSDTCKGKAPASVPAAPPVAAAPDGPPPERPPAGASDPVPPAGPDDASPARPTFETAPPAPATPGSGTGRKPAPSSSSSLAPPRGGAALSGSGRAGPPTTRTANDLGPVATTAPGASAAAAPPGPDAGPGPTGAPAPAPASPTTASPALGEPFPDGPDSAQLSMAIAGLIHGAAPPRRLPDRRGVALLAVVLLATDGLAIAALWYRSR